MIKTEDRVIDCFAKNTYEVPVELEILGSDQSSPNDTHGCFRILSQKDGDKRVVWNRMVMAEIAAAKKMFMDLTKKGMMPYKVGVNGERSSTIMKEFDATAEEVIFMPMQAITGG